MASFPKQYGVGEGFSRFQDSLERLSQTVELLESQVSTLQSSLAALTARLDIVEPVVRDEHSGAF